MTEALRRALDEEMQRDPEVILLGEDIAAYGGAFGVTRGLFAKYGGERVINTPISELGFVGAAVGAALVGSRPVVEIMFMDFLALASDQLVNQAAKLHYVFGEQARCPLVVRTAAGAGRCYGPTHSQNLEAWFVNTPGIKVVAPATAGDAAGLLKAAIRDDNPVLFMEHKLLYGMRFPVAEEDEAVIPIGKARIARAGSDVTLVAWSHMVHTALAAAERLQAYGVEAEVIDLRSLSPMDTDTIVESACRTGRLVIAEESNLTGGVGADIAYRVFEHAYDYLDAPIRRIAAPDIPIPAGPVLEQAMIPDATRIAEEVLGLMDL